MPPFPRSARLTRPSEFRAVRERGTGARSGPIAVSVMPGESKRVGIAASRRVGNAVARNRMKRVIREHFRQNRELYPSGDCVVIPGAGAAKLSNDEFRERLSKVLAAIKKKTGES